MNNKEARGTLANLEADYRDLDPLVLTDDSIPLVNKRIEALGMAISALQAQDSPKPTAESAQNVQNEDLISRKVAIEAVDSETVSTNPEHFKSSEKFIKFMDDADIASFGKWQWANGFNTAVVAARIQLKKLPSAQPERKKGKWIDAVLPNDSGGLQVQVCNQCNTFFPLAYTGGGHNFCPNCGADLRGDNHD